MVLTNACVSKLETEHNVISDSGGFGTSSLVQVDAVLKKLRNFILK
jgi:hypothetical protein